MTQSKSVRKSEISLIVLAIAHLWFVGLHYIRLWSIEHYQFFPFALAAFGWLLHTRRKSADLKLDLPAKILIAADVLLLATAFFLNSPWLGCVGAIVLTFAFCRSQHESASEQSGSLGYLALLPLITLRLPLAFDLQLMHWLQAATTRFASRLLNYFGYLHLREGNVLEFPGKRFLVEEACSGVQSLFTVIFLAALMICVQRRKIVHSALLLTSAFGAAAVMNVVRVAGISVAWQQLEMDLSTGWQHDATGYVSLIVAAMLVLFTDAFLKLFFAAVPNEGGASKAAAYRNPFIWIWNGLLQLPAGKRSAKIPQFVHYFSPKLLWGWSINFATSWFSSRDAKLLPVGVLFLSIGQGKRRC